MQQPDTAAVTESIPPEAMAAAQAQAASDLALLASLNEKRAAAKAEGQEPMTITTDAVARKPLNRAERRQQVSLYAQLLASTERQTPVVNPTIIPKASRRRQKRSRFSRA